MAAINAAIILKALPRQSLLCEPTTPSFLGEWRLHFFICLIVTFYHATCVAAVLPENRADALYHYYKGGGVTVDGPALLVREDIANNISVSASYYADTVSSASIDVVTTASPYKEKRTEYGGGIDFLHRDSLMSLSFTNSKEPDYIADSLNVDYAQDFFGGMTTASLGYSYGNDTLSENNNPTFKDQANRYQYRLGVSQIITSTLRVNLDYEAITDGGYLNSPYRSARFNGAAVPENYPRSRSSHALAFRTIKYFPSHASARFDYRFFRDTWEIAANTAELAYNTYIAVPLLMELRYRYYIQNNASFYSDNIKQSLLPTYRSRDKELSSFTSHAIGAKLSYELKGHPAFVNKLTANISYDFIRFNYDDFTDVRNGQRYNFDANVLQLFLSVWY